MEDEHRYVEHRHPEPGILPENQIKDYLYDLTKHRNRIYSQHGEEGSMRRLLGILGIDTGWCCEFGSDNGVWFSNTYHLIEKGWKGVYIEKCSIAYKELQETQKKHPDSLIIFNEAVHFLPEKGVLLDDILARTPIPKDFDILSIDVDGPDYQIWESLVNYRPKIVLIEASGLDGWHIHREDAKRNDPDLTSSFAPLKVLGESKGYKLITLMGNVWFLAEEYIVDTEGTK